jgi:lipid-A-disaccharide synthase-like uncharacterized protein
MYVAGLVLAVVVLFSPALHGRGLRVDDVAGNAGFQSTSNSFNTTTCFYLGAGCPQSVPVDFRTIPYIENIVSPSFLSISNLFDVKKMKQCLKDRYVVLLGDSTMSERMVDMAVTMGSVSRNVSALNELLLSEEISNTWIRVHHELPKFNSKNFSSYHYYDDVVMAFHGWHHRNITLTLTNDRMKIRYRFIGHYDVHRNSLGVTALSFIKDELMYMLGLENTSLNTTDIDYHRVPNAIVLQSGYHDVANPAHGVGVFIRTLRSFVVQTMLSYYHAAVTVPTFYWQSPPLHESNYTSVVKLRMIEDEVFKMSRVLPHFVYINNTQLFDHIPGFESDTSRYTYDFIHFGAITRRYNMSRLGTVSVMMTNYLLTHICATENYVGNKKLDTLLFPKPFLLRRKPDVLSLKEVDSFHSRWLKFVGSIKVSGSSRLVCLLVGRIFSCPPANEISRFTAMVHVKEETLDERFLSLFTSIDLPPLVNNSVICAHSDGLMFWLNNGMKFQANNQKVFFNRGWEFSQVIRVEDECLELFLTGESLNE